MANVAGKPPGVLIEEITPAGPIAGTGTSTVALLGVPEKRPASPAPVFITNLTEYANTFGAYIRKEPGAQGQPDTIVASALAFAARGFFENGGTTAYVVPLADTSEASVKAGLELLDPLGEVSLVCAPGVTAPAVQQLIIGHCERRGDRFAILDGAPDPKPADAAGALQKQRGGLDSPSGFGALYWPWIVCSSPVAGEPATFTVAPSGHIAGVFARSDEARGVHKAPANETIRGAVDLDTVVDAAKHGLLNDLNINVLRLFPGRPPLVFGARTLTKNSSWRYVNVRRLVSFVEDSLIEGTRWAVFEPNNTQLWKALARTITEFLTRVWESGALFGSTADKAFYVRVDDELNPPDVRNQGQVIVEIGLAVVRPAEYVVFRIGLWDGGSQALES